MPGAAIEYAVLASHSVYYTLPSPAAAFTQSSLRGGRGGGLRWHFSPAGSVSGHAGGLRFCRTSVTGSHSAALSPGRSEAAVGVSRSPAPLALGRIPPRGSSLQTGAAIVGWPSAATVGSSSVRPRPLQFPPHQLTSLSFGKNSGRRSATAVRPHLLGDRGRGHSLPLRQMPQLGAMIRGGHPLGSFIPWGTPHAPGPSLGAG